MGDFMDLLMDDEPESVVVDDAPSKTAAFYTMTAGKVWISAEHIEVKPVPPPGVYAYDHDDSIRLHARPMPRSRIHLDDDQATVLRDVQKFWDAAETYRGLGFPHKRGLLLFGPPGTGKTTCLRAISREVVRHGGYVLLFGHPPWMTLAIDAIRATAPAAPIMVAIEDLDNHTGGSSEAALLNAMDGSFRVEHVLWVATSNHPTKLSERMVRPSRFDMKIEVGFPTEAVRRHYIVQTMPKADKGLVDKLVAESANKSIADIKEAIIQRTVFA